MKLTAYPETLIVIGKKHEEVRNIRYENKLTIVDMNILSNVTYVTEAHAFI